MKTFAELQRLDFFIVESDCGCITGKAELMKLNGLEAICIASENSSYIKGMQYVVYGDQKVISTVL